MGARVRERPAMVKGAAARSPADTLSVRRRDQGRASRPASWRTGGATRSMNSRSVS